MRRSVAGFLWAATGLILMPAAAMAMDAAPVSVPEPSSALMLLSSIPAVAVGIRLARHFMR